MKFMVYANEHQQFVQSVTLPPGDHFTIRMQADDGMGTTASLEIHTKDRAIYDAHPPGTVVEMHTTFVRT